MTFTRFFNAMSQTFSIGTAATVAAFVDDPKILKMVLGACVVLSSACAIWAHAFNPDGTKAEVAYVPEKKQ